MNSIAHCYTTEFLQILDSLNLTQHVTIPTHIKGHTLDLVISNSSCINNLHTHDLGVSDHKAISMQLPIQSAITKQQRQICFRNLKAINPDNLNNGLTIIPIPSHLTPVNQLVNHYNNSLDHILEVHAPLKTRTVTFARSAPWFKDDLRKMKTAGRVLERRSIKSRLTVHKMAYAEHQKNYSRELNAARSQFYSNTINNSPGTSKQLFSVINKLLQSQALTLANNTTEEQCNKFILYFTTKVEGIRSSLGMPDPISLALSPGPAQGFSDFVVTTPSEVESIIRKMKSSTCALDPIPTPLLKSNAAAISPLISRIINSSLQTGQVPTTLKSVLISPILKKKKIHPGPWGRVTSWWLLIRASSHSSSCLILPPHLTP